MRSRLHRSSRGYSLAELLTVVAIVGILSLISVPMFMNYQRATAFKSEMGKFVQDLRNARQYAITRSVDVCVEFEVGAASLRRYRFFASRDNMATWTALQLPGTFGAAGPGTAGNMKIVSEPVYILSSTGLPTAHGGSGNADIVFRPNGTMELAAAATAARVTMATDWTNVAFNRYTINLSAGGQIKTVGSKV